MRFRHPDGTVVHLAYGTNVLPAEDVDGLAAQAGGFGTRLCERLGVATVGLGLWLPAQAAHRLAGDLDAVQRLREALRDGGVEVVTLNCFPFAAFQGPVVKHRVYHPTWAQRERLDYTLAAARVLAALLPADAAHGSISTLPLAWHDPWTAEDQATAEEHLAELADGLATLEAETGRHVDVAVEPEPGCVVETTTEAVARLDAVRRDHVGVCLDLCHLAVAFEDAAGAWERLGAARLRVPKVQLSAALVADDPAAPETRAVLAGYTEDRFLHQVRHAGGCPGCDDLPAALDGLDDGAAWHVHFHVPVHADPRPPLRNTRDRLRADLLTLLGGPRAHADHLELETYTWAVLPGGAPADDDALADGLAAELAWARDELVALGLTPLPEGAPA